MQRERWKEMCFAGLPLHQLHILFTPQQHGGGIKLIRNIIRYFGDGVKMTGATFGLTWSPKHMWEHFIYHLYTAYRVIQPEDGPN